MVHYSFASQLIRQKVGENSFDMGYKNQKGFPQMGRTWGWVPTSGIQTDSSYMFYGNIQNLIINL